MARVLTPTTVRREVYGAFPAEGFAPVSERLVPLRVMYRSGRSGSPHRAVDIGGRAGTPVLAPVDGVVTEVKPYALYGVARDVEVHIQPSTARSVEVVLIHLDRVNVAEGQRVRGGLTRIAVVRKLSGRLRMQLGQYSHEAGDHVHLQVNIPSSAPGPHAHD